MSAYHPVKDGRCLYSNKQQWAIFESNQKQLLLRDVGSGSLIVMVCVF